MGLDMYLTARKFYFSHRGKRMIEDGLEVESKELAVGYWRKHHDLHGYIVEEFADGVDDCQDIGLDPDQIKNILNAITNDLLPYDDKSLADETIDEIKKRDVAMLNKALTWLETPEDGVWKSIIYRASW
jgi:hypothetical protein